MTLPSQPFRVIARGMDAGLPFQRIVPTLFRAQPVSVFPDSVPYPVTPGTPAIVSFFVRNVGPTATFDLAARDDRGFVTTVSPQTLVLEQNAIGSVQVTVLAPLINPAVGAPSTTTHLTVSAAVQGQPQLANSAFVNLDVVSVPPTAVQATYYLHVESSTTLGALQLTTSVPDSPVQTRTSGNMKGRAAGTGSFGRWDAQEGVPGYEGVIPTGAAVTVTLWLKKTSSWGTVFPYATMKVNDAFGAFFCAATGTTPLSITLNPYTFSCTTTEPITMFSTDRLVVFPGYSMTTGPGNHNMEIQMQLEGTSGSRFIMPNPR